MNGWLTTLRHNNRVFFARHRALLPSRRHRVLLPSPQPAQGQPEWLRRGKLARVLDHGAVVR